MTSFDYVSQNIFYDPAREQYVVYDEDGVEIDTKWSYAEAVRSLSMYRQASQPLPLPTDWEIAMSPRDKEKEEEYSPVSVSHTVDSEVYQLSFDVDSGATFKNLVKLIQAVNKEVMLTWYNGLG